MIALPLPFLSFPLPFSPNEPFSRAKSLHLIIRRRQLRSAAEFPLFLHAKRVSVSALKNCARPAGRRKAATRTTMPHCNERTDKHQVSCLPRMRSKNKLNFWVKS